MERQIDRWISAATAVMPLLYRSVVPKGTALDLPINPWSYPHLRSRALAND